ncbi:MAG: metallophosphoesterase, partial [Myxococcota bacterium]
MIFFFVFFSVFAAAYAYVGLQLTGERPSVSRWPWVVLAVHFIAVFVAFSISRSVGPAPWAKPLYWFVYVGMGLFSLVFTGLVLRDLGWTGTRLLDGWFGTGVLPTDPERRQFLVGGFNVWILGSAGLAGAYGVFSARRKPTVVPVDVPIDDLPAGLDGFLIAQVSDLHVGPTIGADYARMVVDIVNGLSPDMVALTGDFVDGSVEKLRDGMAPLADLRSTYGSMFVTGNHEYYSGAQEWCAEMERLGAKVLLNEHTMIEHKDAKLLVAGVTDYRAHTMMPAHASDANKAMAGAPEADATILLAHQPKSCEAAKHHGFDLQLSGHTHGGQMFPWNFFVWLAQPFTKGLHRFGRGWVYVNTGTGYWGPPMRIGVQSEITLVR